MARKRKSNKLVTELLAGFKGVLTGSDPKVYAVPKQRLSTGCLALDYLLGGGGLPAGWIYEIYGEPAHGKTTLSETLLIEAQKAGGVAGLIPFEPNISTTRLERMGMDLDNLIIFQPDTLEDCFVEMKQFLDRKLGVDKDAPGVLVLDTIAAAPTVSEINNEKDGMMQRYKIIKSKINTVMLSLAKANVSLIIVNQSIASPNPYQRASSGGGWGIKFSSKVRMLVKLKKYIQMDGKEDGILTSVRVMKSQVDDCLVNTRALFYIGHSRGIDDDYSTYYNLEEAKVITFNRNKYKFDMAGEEVVFSWDEWRSVLADPVKGEFLRNKLREVVSSSPLQPEKDSPKEKIDLETGEVLSLEDGE